MDQRVVQEARNYCRSAYRDLLRSQVYLSDIGTIPMSYTDKLSISELDYLLDVTNEYIKDKNEAQNKV